MAGARALGDVGGDDVAALAGWSLLAGGEVDAAVAAFRSATLARPQDLHAWEGLRSPQAARAIGRRWPPRASRSARACGTTPAGPPSSRSRPPPGSSSARAATRGARRRSTPPSSATGRTSRPSTGSSDAFRERRDGTKLLALAQARLEVVDDGGGGDQEIAKLHWERARARERGDPEALLALENVVEREPDHVGALALTGEIFLKRGMFEEAADKLTDLLQVEHAPSKNRITAGVAAADVYENKLGRPDDAMAVLLYLHRAGLSSLAVKERLARSTARLGAWAEATEILEVLMRERPEREGRVEAARLAAAIHRDRLGAPAAAVPALSTLLDEAPGDPEALDALLALGGDPAARRPYLERGRAAIHAELLRAPRDLAKLHLLARLSHALGDGVLEHAALAACVAVGGPDGQTEAMLAMRARRPASAGRLRSAPTGAVLAPGDDRPDRRAVRAALWDVAEAFGPSLVGLGVTKKDASIRARASRSAPRSRRGRASAFRLRPLRRRARPRRRSRRAHGHAGDRRRRGRERAALRTSAAACASCWRCVGHRRRPAPDDDLTAIVVAVPARQGDHGRPADGGPERVERLLGRAMSAR